MEKNFSRIKNYNVSVKEVDGKVIFLRKLEKGGSEHSFGIHVAEIAGMPRSIVKRANVILKQLESDNAQVGQGISYQGIPYYLSQMNEWVRLYSTASNDILRSGTLDDGSGKQLAVRPEHIQVTKGSGGILSGTVRTVMMLGHYLEMTLDTEKGLVKVYINSDQADQFEKGDQVALNFDHTYSYNKE